MRSHEIGPVRVVLEETARTPLEWRATFTIYDQEGSVLAKGDNPCPPGMNPEGLQSAYETLLWLTTEDEVGDLNDPEWRAHCDHRHQCIIDEDLWEALETEIAVYAMAFETAAWEIEGDSE